jgi:hypothetical protein
MRSVAAVAVLHNFFELRLSDFPLTYVYERSYDRSDHVSQKSIGLDGEDVSLWGNRPMCLEDFTNGVVVGYVAFTERRK